MTITFLSHKDLLDTLFQRQNGFFKIGVEMCQNVLNLYEVRNQGKMLPKFANKNIGIYIHDTCKADLG